MPSESASRGGVSRSAGKADMLCFPRLSLGNLSPINSIPKDHLLVILKSYFDAANEANIRPYDRVRLVSASSARHSRV